jgi:predicted DNA-binding transcriptional regulator AlpA
MPKSTQKRGPGRPAKTKVETAAAPIQREPVAVPIPPELANFDQLPDSGFVRLPVVRGLYGFPAPSTIWRAVRAGRIPAPTKLGPNITAWRVGDLRAALAAAGGAS